MSLAQPQRKFYGKQHVNSFHRACSAWTVSLVLSETPRQSRLMFIKSRKVWRLWFTAPIKLIKRGADKTSRHGFSHTELPLLDQCPQIGVIGVVFSNFSVGRSPPPTLGTLEEQQFSNAVAWINNRAEIRGTPKHNCLLYIAQCFSSRFVSRNAEWHHERCNRGSLRLPLRYRLDTFPRQTIVACSTIIMIRETCNSLVVQWDGRSRHLSPAFSSTDCKRVPKEKTAIFPTHKEGSRWQERIFHSSEPGGERFPHGEEGLTESTWRWV